MIEAISASENVENTRLTRCDSEIVARSWRYFLSDDKKSTPDLTDSKTAFAVARASSQISGEAIVAAVYQKCIESAYNQRQEIPMADEPKEESLSDYGYTAFEHWEYQPFIYVHEQPKSWISFKESFYRASEFIMDNLARGNGFPEIEGIAAVFLFRHYLELVLKSIILNGRWLVTADQNATRDRVEAVRNIHGLERLWQMVLEDGKPKIDPKVWNSYDIPFVEKCVAEFHARDEKGFAFRYPRQGGEKYDFDFGYFRAAMEHVRQVLENMDTYLIETYGQNQEWEDIQNSY